VDQIDMVTGISPDNEAFLDHAVAAGQFPSREAALDEAIRALRSKRPPAEPIRRRQFATAEEWIEALRQMRERFKDVTAVADDSRESIY
jgi:hypothetical protein